MNSSKATRVTLSDLLVLAAVAVLLILLIWPKLLRSQRAANEAAAVATLKEINESEITYAATYPAAGFAETLDQLGGREQDCVPGPKRACLLGRVAQAPYVLHGYRFAAAGVGEGVRTSFYATAVPERVGATGQISFCTSNLRKIRYSGRGALALSGDHCESWPVWK